MAIDATRIDECIPCTRRMEFKVYVKKYLEYSLNLITSCNMWQAACAIRVYPFAFRSKITKICMAIWTTFFDVNLWQFKTSF